MPHGGGSRAQDERHARFDTQEGGGGGRASANGALCRLRGWFGEGAASSLQARVEREGLERRGQLVPRGELQREGLLPEVVHRRPVARLVDGGRVDEHGDRSCLDGLPRAERLVEVTRRREREDRPGEHTHAQKV
eukprot:2394228-Prymnesium_polylepis.1